MAHLGCLVVDEFKIMSKKLSTTPLFGSISIVRTYVARADSTGMLQKGLQQDVVDNDVVGMRSNKTVE